MRFLAELYSRRIVNVNVNVVLAGLLALPPTVLVVYLSRHLGVTDDQAFLITAITFFADIVFDVAIYFALHWLANHMPRRSKWIHPAYEGLSFVRDATLVQFERAVISPLLYCVALGLQHYLMLMGSSRERATVIGFIVGIAVARVIHTLWMLRNERRAMAKVSGRNQQPPAQQDRPAPTPPAPAEPKADAPSAAR